MTSPSLILPARIAFIAFSSESHGLAVPVKLIPSLPVILATPPSGARLPYITTKWLSVLIGLDSGCTIFCPFRYGYTLARFCAIVLPVTLMQSPCSNPARSNVFIIG